MQLHKIFVLVLLPCAPISVVAGGQDATELAWSRRRRIRFKRVKDIILKVKASNNGIDASVANLPEYPEDGLK